MKFFNVKDLLKSWSVWATMVITITPMIDMNTGMFNFIPEEYKPLAVTALGFVTLFARAIVQSNTVFNGEIK